MKNLWRCLVLLSYIASGIDVEGCSSACIRHTDCNSNERCYSGSCVVIETGDGATVDAMTPAASSTPTPSATGSASAAPSATSYVVPQMDAGSFYPSNLTDASYDSPPF
jgi:hypothetical protein